MSLRLLTSRCRELLPEILAVSLILAMTAAALLPILSLSNNKIFLGYIDADQIVYFACAREYFDNGFHITYASPYSNVASSPRIYSHLIFFLFGVLWKAGMSFTLIDYAGRIIAGSVALVCFVRIMKIALSESPIRQHACVLVAIGGGMAWFAASWYVLRDYILMRFSGYNSGLGWFLMWPQMFEEVEGGYGEWHLNLGRSMWMTIEACYHALFAAAVLFAMRKKHGVACVLLFLTWWSHPYTGIELGLVLTLFFAVETRMHTNGALQAALVSGIINVVFLAYYLLYLPQFPEHQSVWSQMHNFGNPLLWWKLLPAFGLLIPLTFFALPGIKSRLLCDSNARLMLIWLVVVAGLMFNDRLPGWKAVQPLHFGRGYLYVPLVYFAVVGGVAAVRHCRGKFVMSVQTFGIVLLILHLPDNAIWLVRTKQRLDKQLPKYAISTTEQEMLRRLDALPDVETILTLGKTVVSNDLVPVYTKHRIVLSHIFNVPFHDKKVKIHNRLLERFTKDDLRELHVSILAMEHKHYERFVRELPDAGELLFKLDDTYVCRVR